MATILTNWICPKFPNDTTGPNEFGPLKSEKPVKTPLFLTVMSMSMVPTLLLQKHTLWPIKKVVNSLQLIRELRELPGCENIKLHP